MENSYEGEFTQINVEKKPEIPNAQKSARGTFKIQSWD